MRRRIVLLVVLGTLATSCSAASPEGPGEPAGLDELGGSPAILQAQVRAATLRFVEAYRDAVLGGDDLEAVTGNPLLRRWAYWVGVTNRAFPGEITATSTIGGVGPAALVSSDGPLLEVQLAAQIDVVAQPTDGEPLEFSVPMDGPVRLIAEDRGTWRVTDFVRFGVPVSAAFLRLDHRYERPGVMIELDAFGAVPNWSFFVRIAATGDAPVTLAEGDATLVERDGTAVGEAIEVSPPLLRVGAGQRVDGAITFEAVGEVRGVSLRIDLGGKPDPDPLEIPLRSVVAAEGGG
ncbi:MAG: hypothetical protein ACRDGK_10220 [Actinomycetota bacterium]